MSRIKLLNLSFPDEWKIEKLDNLMDFSTGGTPRRNVKEFWVNGTIPWLKSGELNDDFIQSPQEKITELGLKKSSAKIFMKGTLLYALYGKGTVSKTGILAINSATNQAIAAMVPKNSSIISRFLQYFFIFCREKILNNFVNPSSDTGRTNIYMNDLKLFKVPLPSLPEQNKIISYLSNIDDLIFQTKGIIDQLQLLKKGLMQRLFTEGIGHTEFKETRLGKIPKEWKIVTISKIGNVIGGGTPDTRNEKYWNGHITWATPTDITNLNRKFITKTNRNISIEGLNNSSAKLLPPFSLLMTSRASIGYCAINTREICTNQGFQNIIPNKDIDVEFLYYLIQSSKLQNQLVRYAYGSTFLEIPNKDVKKIKIPLPELDEQRKIVSILSNLDNKIINEDHNTLVLKSIKKGLMQELLTGKKRVKLTI